MSHSPGPWIVSLGVGGHTVRSKTGAEIVWVTTVTSSDPGSCITRSDALANAQLIAMAPELLDALEELVDIVDGDRDQIDSFTTQPARLAIKKAKGEKV